MAELSFFLVSEDKLTRYLLDLDHPQGGSKAKFFLARGFTRDAWNDLAQALCAHVGSPLGKGIVADHPVLKEEKRFVVEGPLVCPDGTAPRVKAVWKFHEGSDTAVLVTAYPARERRARD